MSAQLPLLHADRPWAIFSECLLCADPACAHRPYRYELHWPTGLGGAGRALFILANPSTATAEQTDPTVARCINYARSWGFAWCDVGNVRAWRATDPKAVPPDPLAIGPHNDDCLREMLLQADVVVCGWGKLGGVRGPEVLRLIRAAGKTPMALKLNNDGSPQHPLYLRSDALPFALVSP